MQLQQIRIRIVSSSVAAWGSRYPSRSLQRESNKFWLQSQSLADRHCQQLDEYLQRTIDIHLLATRLLSSQTFSTEVRGSEAISQRVVMLYLLRIQRALSDAFSPLISSTRECLVWTS